MWMVFTIYVDDVYCIFGWCLYTVHVYADGVYWTRVLLNREISVPRIVSNLLEIFVIDDRAKKPRKGSIDIVVKFDNFNPCHP